MNVFKIKKIIKIFVDLINCSVNVLIGIIDFIHYQWNNVSLHLLEKDYNMATNL